MGPTPSYGARADPPPKKSRFCHEANEYPPSSAEVIILGKSEQVSLDRKKLLQRLATAAQSVVFSVACVTFSRYHALFSLGSSSRFCLLSFSFSLFILFSFSFC